MEKIRFYKMEGLGNDYVYLICMEKLPDRMSELAKEISDRHYGIGGDGMVVITKSNVADFKMIMFNSDGSEAQMCGNASRCIGRLVYEKGLTEKKEITLETRSGIKKIKLNFSDGNLKSVSVNMGHPFIEAQEIPVLESRNKIPLIRHDVKIEEKDFEIWCIGMGNPHGIIFEIPSEEIFQTYGPLLEKNQIWPEKANIEFVDVADNNNIKMRVWERGTGETLACGTGACASAATCILLGKTESDVNVIMKGGTLNVRLDENGELIMTGDAHLVAEGDYFTSSN